MKTFTTSFAAIIFALSILTSCGAEEKDTDTKESAQDIDVTKLEEPCDFADAMLTCATELDAMSSEVKEGEEPTKDQEAAVKVLTDKMEAIGKAFGVTDMGYAAIKECPAFDKADKLMNKQVLFITAKGEGFSISEDDGVTWFLRHSLKELEVIDPSDA